jgi:hypothetical protein
MEHALLVGEGLRQRWIDLKWCVGLEETEKWLCFVFRSRGTPKGFVKFWVTTNLVQKYEKQNKLMHTESW